MKKHVHFLLIVAAMLLPLSLSAQGAVSALYEETFDNGLGSWTAIDNDADGHNWTVTDGYVMSESYGDDGAYAPDNWLVSPAITLGSGVFTLSWDDVNYDGSYPEHYSVYISTTGGTVADFLAGVQIYDYTFTTEQVWETVTYPLEDYAGQTIWIAFRHWDVEDMWRMGIDNVKIVSSDCPSLTGLTLVNISSSEAVFQWNGSSAYTGYKVYLDGAAYPVTENSVAISQLTPATQYTVQVAGICSNGDTAFSAPLQFTTMIEGGCQLTVTAADSYGDGWNGGSLVIKQNGTTLDSIVVTNAMGKNLQTYTYNVGANVPLSFVWNKGNYDDEVRFTISSSSLSEPLYTCTSAANLNGEVLYLGNPCAVCAAPQGFSVGAITGTTAQFGWEAGDASVWQLVIGGATHLCTTPSYTATGLSPATAYTAVLSSMCSDGSLSASSSVGFTTACDALTLPAAIDFEDASADQLPPCWIAQGGGTAVQVADNNSYLSFSNAGLTVLNKPVAIPATGLRVAFERNGSGYFYYGYVTNPSDASTFVQMGSVNYTDNGWTTYDFIIEDATLGQVYIAFSKSYSSGQTKVDNINVMEFTGCKTPENFTRTGYTDTEISVGWTGSNAQAWEVALSTVYNFIDSVTTIYTSTDTFFTFTGLVPQTYYYYRVRSLCDGYATGWSDYYSNTTLATWPVVADLSLSAAGFETAAFSWYYSVGYAANPLEGWRVGWRTVGETEWQTADLPASNNGSYSLDGLEQGTEYEFAVWPISLGEQREGAMLPFSTLDCRTRMVGVNASGYIPTHANYKYSFTEQIYNAADLQGLGDTLSGIDFHVLSSPVDTFRTVDVYLVNSSLEAFASASSYIPVDQMTLVAQNAQLGLQLGSHHIAFNAPFVRNADSNLIVAVYDHSGFYQGSTNWASVNNVGSGRSLHYYTDSPMTPDAPTGNSGTDAIVAQATFYANICEMPDVCETPVISASEVDGGLNITISPAQPNIAYILRYRAISNNPTDWIALADSLISGFFRFDSRVMYDQYEFEAYRVCNGDTLSANYYTWYSNCNAPSVDAWIDNDNNYVVALSYGDEDALNTIKYVIYNDNTGSYDTVTVGQYTGNDTVTLSLRSSNNVRFFVSRACDNGEVTNYTYWVNANCFGPDMSVWLDSANNYVVAWNGDANMEYTLWYNTYNNATGMDDTVTVGQYTGSDTVTLDIVLRYGVYFYVGCQCDNSMAINSWWMNGNCQTPSVNYEWSESGITLYDYNYREGNEYNIYYRRAWYGDEYTLIASGVTTPTYTVSGFSNNMYWEFAMSRMCGGEEVFGSTYCNGDCAAPSVWTNESGDLQWSYVPGSEYEISIYNENTGVYDVLDIVNDSVYNLANFNGDRSYDFRIGRNCSSEMMYNYYSANGYCQGLWFNTADATAESMTFTWPNEEQIAVMVQWGLRGGEFTDSVLLAAGDTAYTITGLESGTNYQVRLGRECRDGWAYGNTLNWKTNCGGPKAVPYHEDFDSMDLNYYVYDPCWIAGTTSTEPKSGNNWPAIVAFTGNEADHMTRLIGGGWVVLPEVDAPINELQVRVRYVAGGDEAEMILGVLNIDDDFEDLIVLDTIRHGDYGSEQSVWYTYRFDELTDLTKNRIVFYGFQTEGYYSNLAEVTVEMIPPCAEVGGLACTGTTNDGATLTWNAAEGQFVEYVVEYGPKGFALGQGTQATSTTNSITLSGLNPATTYEAYVKVNCGRQGFSHESSVARFTTECVAVDYVYEEFNSYVVPGSTYYGILPTCWTYDPANTNVAVGALPQVTADNDFSLYMEALTYVALPEMSRPLSELMVEFNVIMYGDSLVVGTVSHNGEGFGNTFVPIDTVFGEGQHSVYFDTYTGDNRYIAFKNINATNGFTSIYLPYVNVTDMPTCFAPHNFTATAVDAHTITLDWEMDRPMANYTIMWYDPYVGQWQDTTVTEYPVTIAGLNEQSWYDFELYSICADDNWQYGGYMSVNTPEACPGLDNMYIDSIGINGIAFQWVGGSGTVLVEAWNNNGSTAVLDRTEIVSGSSYTLTGLRSNTYYQLRVYNYCDGEQSNNYSSWWFNTPAVCAEPTSFVASEVATDHLTFTWEGTAAQWHIRSGGGTIDSVFSGNSFTIADPIGGATYEMYLRAVCSELDESGEVYASAVVPCDTLHLTADVSFFENFDNLSSSRPNCWYYEVFNGGGQGYITGNMNRSGSRGMVLGSTTDQLGDMTLATKAFTADTAMALEFYYNSMYFATTFRVDYDTVGADGSVGRVYGDTVVAAVNVWGVYRDTLPTSAVRLYFSYFDLNSEPANRYFGFDDVSLSVLAPATCPAPVAVSVESVGVDYVALVVSGDATATADYAVRLTAPDGTVMELATDDGSVTFTGLMQATTYAISARTLCGDVNSPWMNLGEVTTSCELVAVPHFFDLSNEADEVLPSCWAYDPTAQSYNHGWYPMHKSAYRQNNGIRMVGNMIVALPEVDAAMNTLKLSFTLSSENGSGTVEVGVVDSYAPGFGSTFTPLAVYDQNAGNIEMLLSAYTGTGRRVAFRHVAGDTTNFCSGYITDIVLDNAPACMAPANLTVTEVTTTSVTLDWVDQIPAEMWNIVYDNQSMSVFEHPVTISGLQPNTNYVFVVSTICGGESYSSEVYAATGCNIIAELPYSTGFDEYAVNTMPACWDYDETSLSDNGGWTPQVYNIGDNAMLIVGNAIVTMPEFEADLNTLMLQFDLMMGGGDNITSFEVGVYETSAAGATFVPIDTMDAFNTRVVYFNSYEGQGGRIAFRQMAPTGSFAYTFLDNLILQQAPTCIVPENITATVTTNSVTLDWEDNGTPTAWRIDYNNNNDYYSYNIETTSHPVTIDGLQSGTTYSFCIRAICGEDDMSSQSCVNVTTECEVIEGLPVLFDFDNANLNCWVNMRSNINWYNSAVLYFQSYGEAYAYTPVLATGEEQVLVDFEATPNWNDNDTNWTLVVASVSADGADTIDMQQVTFSAATHVRLTLNMDDAARLLFVNATPAGTFDIDNIAIRRVPNCDMPTELALAEATANSLGFSWDGTATSYGVSLVNIANGAAVNATTSETTYTFGDLRPGTDYLFTVHAICPNGESTTGVELEASTACDIIVDLPFTYDFDQDVQGTLPTCWAYDPMGTTLDETNTMAGVPQVNYYSSAIGSVLNIDYNSIVALPEMAAPISTLTVDFNVVEVGGSAEDAILVAGVVSNAEAGFAETFVGIDTIHFTDASIVGHHSFDFGAYAGDGNRVAFRTVTPTDTWHYLSIDSVVISTTMTPCLPPTGLDAEEVDIEYAVLDWTPSGSETAWEILVENETVYRTITVSEHPVTITGLARGTTYTASVRALCGDSQVPGTWSETLSFTTDFCHPGVPTAVSVTDVVRDGATISWTPAAATDSLWVVELVIDAISQNVAETFGITDFSSIPLNERTNYFTATENPFAIEGMLLPGCTYSVRVATLCDEASGFSSAFSESAQFITDDCAGISDLAVSNITATSATVAWTDDMGNDIRYVYVQPASSAFDWDSIVFEGTAYTTSLEVTGLEPMTTYDVYVETSCGNLWMMSEPYTFTTNRTRHAATVSVNDTLRGSAMVSNAQPWYGDTVVFSATPAVGYHFVGWSNGSTDAVTSVVATSDVALTAYFAINNYTLTISYDATRGSVASATASVPNGTTYTISHGSEVSFTATANGDYRFVGWNDGSTTFETSDITYTVTSDVTLTANFADAGLYYLTVNTVGNGTATGAGEYEEGTEVELTATPAVGSHFMYWILPDNTATSETIAVTVSTDMYVTAVFAPDTHTVAVSTGSELMGAVSGGGEYAYGTAVQIEAIAETGYHFIGWNDGNVVNPRTISLVGDTAFVALFDTNVYQLTVSFDATMGAVEAPAVLKHFVPATLTASANYGYHFVGWSDAMGNMLATGAILAVDAVSDTALVAVFERNAYSVSTGVNDTLMGTATVSNENPLYLDVVTFTAVANTGYHFTGWSNGETDAIINVVVRGDTTVTATFAHNQYAAIAAVNADALGTATVSNAAPYHGDTVVFTAVAAEGCHFTGWSNGDTAASIEIVALGDITLTANFAVNVYNVTVGYDATRGSVVDAAGADVAAGSVFEVEHGTTLHFTASAIDDGSRFVSWTDGTAVLTTETIDYVVTSDVALTATFASNDSAMLTLVVGNAGMGTVSGAGMYQIGDTANITAIPAEHHHFIGWSNGSAEAATTVVVDSDTILTAYFAIDTHTVLVSCDTAMGTVVGAGQYAYGTEATLVATAADGYRFTGWSNGDTVASISFTVVSDTAVEAYFEAIVVPGDTVYYTVSVFSSDTMMGTVSTAGGVFAEGTSLTVTATPNEGYVFVAWMSDTATLATTATYTFTVDADITLTALFAQGQPVPTAYVVSVEVNDPAMGYVEGSGTYNEGSMCTLTAHAYEGYRFVGWMNGDQMASTDSIYSFTVNANITLTAVFERDNDGIDNVDANSATVYSTDGKIVVRGAADGDVLVYDVNGRLVCSELRVADGCEFRMAAAGVYLVKVGNAPAKRVIVVR